MIEIKHSPRKHIYQARGAVWWRRSWLVSTFGHGFLLTFLATDIAALLAILLGLSLPPPGKREPIVLEVQIESDDEEQVVPEVVVDMQQYESPEFFQSAEVVAGTLNYSDPELYEDVDVESDQPDAPVNNVRQLVDAAITQADSQSSEENLNRLDELANRIQSTSSEESINSVTTFVGNILGTEERATRPAEEPVAGVFDPKSGQIDDVIRREQDPEGYIYVAILVDAEGRTMEVILTGPEGKNAYDTFEKIKRYPFLDQIYRGVVMSLLDNALQR